MSAQRRVSEGRPGETMVDGRGALNQFAPQKTRGRMEVTEVTGKGKMERWGAPLKARWESPDRRQCGGGLTPFSHPLAGGLTSGLRLQPFPWETGEVSLGFWEELGESHTEWPWAQLMAGAGWHGPAWCPAVRGAPEGRPWPQRAWLLAFSPGPTQMVPAALPVASRDIFSFFLSFSFLAS